MTEYVEKLKDPRWQKLRLKILERDDWCCQLCYGSEQTLHVHHTAYFPASEPWETPENYLVTLCEDCHREESKLLPDAKYRLLRSLAACRYWSTDLEKLAEAFEKMNEADGPLIDPDKQKLAEGIFKLYKQIWLGMKLDEIFASREQEASLANTGR